MVESKLTRGMERSLYEIKSPDDIDEFNAKKVDERVTPKGVLVPRDTARKMVLNEDTVANKSVNKNTENRLPKP